MRKEEGGTRNEMRRTHLALELGVFGPDHSLHNSPVLEASQARHSLRPHAPLRLSPPHVHEGTGGDGVVGSWTALHQQRGRARVEVDAEEQV